MRRLRPLPLTIALIALLLVERSALFVRGLAGAHVVLPAVAQAHEAPLAKAPVPAPTAAPVVPAPPPEPTISDSERALLLELRQRREQLEQRDTALAQREAMLSAAEKKLSGRLTELSALQKKLENEEAARVQREDAGWQGLVKLYETMKPRDAAVILNDLDMKVLLQVMNRMKEAKAAPILSAMNPDRAREVTDGLAKLRIRDPSALAAKNGPG